MQHNTQLAPHGRLNHQKLEQSQQTSPLTTRISKALPASDTASHKVLRIEHYHKQRKRPQNTHTLQDCRTFCHDLCESVTRREGGERMKFPGIGPSRALFRSRQERRRGRRRGTSSGVGSRGRRRRPWRGLL
jgi:hypothetical protein